MNNVEVEQFDELHLTWSDVLAEEKKKPYFQELLKKVEAFRAAGKTIYPKNSQVFRAFSDTPFDKVKVVILGQDPYHGKHQAHGLSFSVEKGVPPPPSLQNIYKEAQDDVGISAPPHGCLTQWAEQQGVLLLNSVLTVEAEKPASHANLGWEKFMDTVIEKLNHHQKHIVFMLWGSYAQKKGASIDPARHLILKAPHPSPLSAHRGFLGCRHFSKANEYLKKHHRGAINWSINLS